MSAIYKGSVLAHGPFRTLLRFSDDASTGEEAIEPTQSFLIDDGPGLCRLLSKMQRRLSWASLLWYHRMRPDWLSAPDTNLLLGAVL